MTQEIQNGHLEVTQRKEKQKIKVKIKINKNKLGEIGKNRKRD